MRYRPLSISIEECWNNIEQKTLVLNIQTFIYILNDYEEQNNLIFTNKLEIPIYIRPYTREFLMKMSEYYELIFFTSLEVDITRDLLREVWPSEQNLPPILGRESCSLIGDMTIKELEIIRNRKKSNIVILDHLMATWYFDQDNYIPIPPFNPLQMNTRKASDILFTVVIDVLEQLLISSNKFKSPRFTQYIQWLINTKYHIYIYIYTYMYI